VTIQWQYLATPGAGVLSLSGYLGSQATDRFAGAIGWVVARGSGPVIIDLTGLQGWSESGREAVLLAAARLAVDDRPLELAGLPEDRMALGRLPGDPRIRHYPDLRAALSAHAATGPRVDATS
jgi:hypothetical protein